MSFLKDSWLVNGSSLVITLSEISSIIYFITKIIEGVSIRDDAASAIKNKSYTADNCDNDSHYYVNSDLCDRYNEGKSEILISSIIFGLIFLTTVFTTISYLLFAVSKYDKVNDHRYQDCPVNYLLPEHAQRLNKIRSNYQAEFKKYNIRNSIVSSNEGCEISINDSEINDDEIPLLRKK